MSIRQIREKTGLSQSKFAEMFHIPTRTLQKWEIGQASPPPYIEYMLQVILDYKEKECEVKNKL